MSFMADSKSRCKPLAYDAYQELADHYAAKIETKPHNAYYERPAMLEMMPDLRGKRVLDAGCGPGVYAESLVNRGAMVVAIDMSDRMLELARERLGSKADLRLVDLSQPLSMFSNESFDFINAPLCLDYIQDWRQLFAEFHRILSPGGGFQFSCGHPAFDAEYYNTSSYFSVEQVEATWKGFGKEVVMPSFRRSLQEIMMPLIETGFSLQKVIEPLPTAEFRQADPLRFSTLSRRPAFLCVQAKRLGDHPIAR
jgi:ubiquinone/menaquinone biosynthesis C-methylase UbiE